jgi:hypothetical protein
MGLIIGFLAGIGLLFSGNKLIGTFVAIASSGLILKGYKDIKDLKNQVIWNNFIL